MWTGYTVMNIVKILPRILQTGEAYLTIRGVAVIFVFDILTSKSNQFNSVPNCTEVVNLVKFPRAVCTISCSQTF